MYERSRLPRHRALQRQPLRPALVRQGARLDAALMSAVDVIRDQAHEVGRGWSGSDAEPAWALVGALFDALAAALHRFALTHADLLPRGSATATR